MSPQSTKRTYWLDILFRHISRLPASDRTLLHIALLAFICTGIWALYAINKDSLITTPGQGGTLVEGIIGIPRFVNPVLANTRADRDVTALIYRGLMKIAPTGELVPDAAESITLSDDGTTYTIRLRSDVRFHDTTPLTARDVAFTIGLLQDPELKSPYRGSWVDVTVELVSEYELKITLKEPYAPFVENFTIGILPAHLWSTLPLEQIPFSQLNTEPIGAGDFRIARATRDTSGIITTYELAAVQSALGDPNISTIRLRFYPNEAAIVNALNSDSITSTSYLEPSHLPLLTSDASISITTIPLPRLYTVFFNENRSAIVRDSSVRKALTAAIDRSALIEKTRSGFGVPTFTPTTLSFPNVESEGNRDDTSPTSSTTTPADILRAGGWSKTDAGVWEKRIDGETELLSLTIKTSNQEIFQTMAETLAAAWRAIGVEVTIEQYEQSGLVQSVIRPRDFTVLLFGIDHNRSQDLYPFWHSSQKDDPGLNISQYTNLKVDELLETARVTEDQTARRTLLAEASSLIRNEAPAIFLFQPTQIHIAKDTVVMTSITDINHPADRFMNVADWYVREEQLWPILNNRTQ